MMDITQIYGYDLDLTASMINSRSWLPSFIQALVNINYLLDKLAVVSSQSCNYHNIILMRYYLDEVSVGPSKLLISPINTNLFITVVFENKILTVTAFIK